MLITYQKTDRSTIKIEVKRDGKVVVYYPNNCSRERAEQFVNTKKGWIDKKVGEITANYSKNIELFDLQSLLLLGKKVNIQYEKSLKKPVLTDTTLILPADAQNDIDKKKSYLRKFVKTSAADVLPQCVSHFAEKMDKCPTKIAISQQKSIWGSCNAKKEIRLNAKLIMLPISLMEYVVIHELCHLTELNHSAKFWALVNSYCDSAACRKNLKKYNYLISLF